MPREGTEPALRSAAALVVTSNGGWPARGSHRGKAVVGAIRQVVHRNRIAIAVSAALVGLVMIFALAGVATATVICNYALCG